MDPSGSSGFPPFLSGDICTLVEPAVEYGP